MEDIVRVKVLVLAGLLVTCVTSALVVHVLARVQSWLGARAAEVQRGLTVRNAPERGMR
ncbi:MAG TPA: hypothetical protein VLK28_12095 [Methylomirabilota bacterium]|nr:hypothetical protein [Methylomirabilota bacterium]